MEGVYGEDSSRSFVGHESYDLVKVGATPDVLAHNHIQKGPAYTKRPGIYKKGWQDQCSPALSFFYSWIGEPELVHNFGIGKASLGQGVNGSL